MGTARGPLELNRLSAGDIDAGGETVFGRESASMYSE